MTQETQVKHTPIPWRVSAEGDRLMLIAPWSEAVAKNAEGWGDYRGIHVAWVDVVDGGSASREWATNNFAYIVRAVNNFPKLLSAAKYTLENGPREVDPRYRCAFCGGVLEPEPGFETCEDDCAGW